MRVRQIFLEIPEKADDSQIQQIQAIAQELVQQLRTGADFSEIAKMYSEHPSANSGGELGIFKSGELASPFDIAFSLQDGEITEPIRSEKGFHIITAQQGGSGEQAIFERVKSQIQERVFEEKSEKRYVEWIAGLKTKAYIEIK